MAIPPFLIAAGASFLMSKATGASNKQALMSGILSGIGAYGVGKLGAGLQAASQAPTVAPSIGATTPTGLMPAPPPPALTGNPLAGSEIAGKIGGALAKPSGQIAVGTALGSYPQMAAADKAAQMQAEKMANPFGLGAYDQAYETAQADLSGIGQRATYDDDNMQQQNLYNFSQPMFAAKEGGIAEIAKYREGGVNYLPSKPEHDEKDANNYVRAKGYVEDGSGNGNKDEDTMLAQLADGEFVSRADAVLGAGIMSGANPNDFKQMREFGAKYFYNQQDQLKRIYDMVG